MHIGLTGGIGCGKSTVLQFFEEAGLKTQSSDAIVRELLDADKEVQSALGMHFGEHILSGGVIDRKALGGIVFQDEKELKWLEELLHPYVRQRWMGLLSENSDENCVIEIPLLFEKSLEKHFDFTLCITCSYERQIERLTQRGLPEVDAKRRIQRQLPLDEKAKRADFVVTNDGTREFLRRQINVLIETEFSC